MALATVQLAGAAGAWAAVTAFSHQVVDGNTINYSIKFCGSGTLSIYYDRQSEPTASTKADDEKRVSDSCWSEDGSDGTVSFTRTGVPVGLHTAYVRFQEVVSGPVTDCVGPALQLESFSVRSEGAQLTYLARVCNRGTMPAYKFRVGFWPHHDGKPSAGDMGRLFEPITALAHGEGNEACEDLEVLGDLQPNGDFVAWASPDSGDGFVAECIEDKDRFRSHGYRLRNPDLVLKKLSSRPQGGQVTYEVKVCNEGAANVGKFFVDVYYGRDEEGPPKLKEPGDEAKPIRSLAQGRCSSVSFTRPGTPRDTDVVYAVVDADDFVSEPEEGNNHSGAHSPAGGPNGSGNGEENCVDNDQDGAGVGPDCKGVPDCDDGDPQINPQTREACDGIDQDCDLTPDDGCPGVACVDKDGDGFGVGADCVLQDYNDSDPQIYPWAPPERQGEGVGCIDSDQDGWGVGPGCLGVPDCDDHDRKRHPGVPGELCSDDIDNDCDQTVNDGCEGVDCKDGDGDGWGVGADCRLADPDDTNPSIHPYSACRDEDGDGWGVGADCRGVPDCDDTDPQINGGTREICGDGIDNDCDLTVDDGCEGVACTDGDGDGIGVGEDCVVSDCNDADPEIHPWAAESCGDNDDDNCNRIADDGCHNRQCRDRDGDGSGVGPGCPGAHDCDDLNYFVHPGASEVCGDGIDQDCDGVADDGCDSSVDSDGDGAAVGGGATGQPDCDDTLATVGPGQTEICGDNIDNNCNTTVDDGCPGVSCTDADKDGWGVGADCVLSDCNDADSAVHPWAEEVCGDDVDNDCDGTVDDGCDGVDCVDADFDSWGIGKDCARQDCDDSDGGSSPWQRERCNDGLDNDCDGSVDEGCLACRDADQDGHGVGPQCVSWDCNDEDSATYPGADEICDLQDNDCDEHIPTSELECALDQPGCGCRVRDADGARRTVLLALFLLLLVYRRRRR